ncbi:lipopolysaccharide biosynthesis protein [Noviherbaspirillum aridicola]|uniref:O-antigen/teichoic acid export membrane protein n=1 Tax=Noviherbaspirillum aridicola TaxID=2849687 RepID=A0ABQ4Q3H2_9BURK|nr:oligosaccharide flippase family protein [Noviherbaspirillum aridicola]GIZ51289.1 Lsg locus putative protein 1 [Noviherbaspirillum aridicola]
MKAEGCQSSREAMSDNRPAWRRLAENAVIYTVSNAASSAVPFLLLPFLTRWLSPEEYGLVTMYSTLLAALGALAGLSVHGAVSVRMFDRQTSHARYIGTALYILGVSLLAVAAAVLLASPWLEAWSGLPAGWLLLAVLAAGGQFLVNIRLVVWQVEGKALRYGSFQFLQVAVNVGLSLLLVAGLHHGWSGRLAGISIALYLFAAIGLASLMRAGRIEWRFDPEYARDALRFGVPLMPHAIGSLFIAAGDRMIIAGALNLHEVGMYAAAMQIGLVISMIADAVTKALGPWIYKVLADGDATMKRRVVRMTYAYFAGMLALGVGFGFLAPWLLAFLGEQYRSGATVIRWVALGGAFSGMYLMVVAYVFYAKRSELLSAASLTIGLGNLALSYFLVTRHGAVGAAQAYAASQFLMFVVVWLIAAKCHPMPWRGALRNPVPNQAI